MKLMVFLDGLRKKKKSNQKSKAYPNQRNKILNNKFKNSLIFFHLMLQKYSIMLIFIENKKEYYYYYFNQKKKKCSIVIK